MRHRPRRSRRADRCRGAESAGAIRHGFWEAVTPAPGRIAVPLARAEHATPIARAPGRALWGAVQRKVLPPNDFPCLEAVAERLANFERYCRPSTAAAVEALR